MTVHPDIICLDGYFLRQSKTENEQTRLILLCSCKSQARRQQVNLIIKLGTVRLLLLFFVIKEIPTFAVCRATSYYIYAFAEFP